MCYGPIMTKMIQVRDVPDSWHKELTKRAKRRSQTLSDYVKRLLERDLATPLAEDVFDEIERSIPVAPEIPSAEFIRAAREERDRHLEQLWNRTREDPP